MYEIVQSEVKQGCKLGIAAQEIAKVDFTRKAVVHANQRIYGCGNQIAHGNVFKRNVEGLISDSNIKMSENVKNFKRLEPVNELRQSRFKLTVTKVNQNRSNRHTFQRVFKTGNNVKLRGETDSINDIKEQNIFEFVVNRADGISFFIKYSSNDIAQAYGRKQLQQCMAIVTFADGEAVVPHNAFHAKYVTKIEVFEEVFGSEIPFACIVVKQIAQGLSIKGLGEVGRFIIDERKRIKQIVELDAAKRIVKHAYGIAIVEDGIHEGTNVQRRKKLQNRGVLFVCIVDVVNAVDQRIVHLVREEHTKVNVLEERHEAELIVTVFAKNEQILDALVFNKLVVRAKCFYGIARKLSHKVYDANMAKALNDRVGNAFTVDDNTENRAEVDRRKKLKQSRILTLLINNVITVGIFFVYNAFDEEAELNAFKEGRIILAFRENELVEGYITHRLVYFLRYVVRSRHIENVGERSVLEDDHQTFLGEQSVNGSIHDHFVRQEFCDLLGQNQAVSFNEILQRILAGLAADTEYLLQ